MVVIDVYLNGQLKLSGKGSPQECSTLNKLEPFLKLGVDSVVDPKTVEANEAVAVTVQLEDQNAAGTGGVMLNGLINERDNGRLYNEWFVKNVRPTDVVQSKILINVTRRKTIQ